MTEHFFRRRIAQNPIARWYIAFVALTGKEFRVMTRYPLEFAAGFVQVFLIMAVLVFASLMFTPATSQSSHDKLLVSGILVYGFVLFIFITEIVWNMGYNLRKEQRQGTLEQLYLTPAPVSAVLFSRLAISLIWTAFLCSISLWLMVALVGSLPFANPSAALLVFVLSLSSICGVGLMLAALSFFVKEAAQTVATVVQFGFVVVCAPFFPFSALPRWIRWVSRLVPLSYSVDSLRAALMGYPRGYPELASARIELLIIATSGLLLPLIGMRLYRHAETQARRTGTLGAY